MVHLAHFASQCLSRLNSRVESCEFEPRRPPQILALWSPQIRLHQLMALPFVAVARFTPISQRPNMRLVLRSEILRRVIGPALLALSFLFIGLPAIAQQVNPDLFRALHWR